MTDPCIDAAIFENLKAMMGADFIGELIDAYFEETPQLIGQIEQALASGDAEIFRRAAHSLKSSSASFGAMQFSAKAKELEWIGKEGNLAGTGEKVASLKADYIMVHDTIEALRNGA
jgi:HPt (histidine-containing phosphotransfer) domain-containing protein